jgi:hypothetical protein
MPIWFLMTGSKTAAGDLAMADSRIAPDLSRPTGAVTTAGDATSRSKRYAEGRPVADSDETAPLGDARTSTARRPGAPFVNVG